MGEPGLGLGTEEAWDGGREGVVAGGMLGRPGKARGERLRRRTELGAGVGRCPGREHLRETEMRTGLLPIREGLFPPPTPVVQFVVECNSFGRIVPSSSPKLLLLKPISMFIKRSSAFPRTLRQC